MSARRAEGRGLAAALSLALCVVAQPARAEDGFGTDDPTQQVIVYSLAVTSVLGTLTTGIAGAVYALRGEAFDTPWLVAALFSGALTMGTGVSLLTFQDDASPIIGGTLMVVSAWPLGYSVRSALSPAGFGQPFDGPPEASEPIEAAALAAPVPRAAALLAPPGARLVVPILSLEL